MEIPKFLLYGETDPKTQERIQKTLPWRSWDQVSEKGKEIAFQQLINENVFLYKSDLVENTIKRLNNKFLRKLYGKNLHYCMSEYLDDYQTAAMGDFREIFTTGKSDVVFYMLSIFAEGFINQNYLRQAKESNNNVDRKEYIEQAFIPFNKLQNCLNHIFGQFHVNQQLTWSGFIPRQDERILDQIYIPTIKCLSDPKWSLVNNDLSNMFQDYRNGNYRDTITKAHNVLQRFLQIFLNKRSKNAKGELGKLFSEAKNKGVISNNIFIMKIIEGIQSFVSSERATKSTAKPAFKNVTSADALLVMNAVMVFLQYCLEADATALKVSPAIHKERERMAF